jgi:hypothetical protein
MENGASSTRLPHFSHPWCRWRFNNDELGVRNVEWSALPMMIYE